MNGHRFRVTGMMILLLLPVLPGTGNTFTVPDTFTLNREGRLYKPFSFDHAKHIRLNKECADCHHHTTGTLVENPNCIRCHRNSDRTLVVACRGCHAPDPFSAATMKTMNVRIYHADKPGLKGAMHQSCIGCHTRQSGPTGCRDCHARTPEGDAFYSSGQFAPPRKAVRTGHGGR